MWNCTHPKRIFRKTIFRPLGGAAPKFLHALENDQVLLAHPHRGRGPLTFSFKGGDKIGLNVVKERL